MNKKGFEWLNVTIVVMSVIIVLFSAIALTVIYDSYHPGDEAAKKTNGVVNTNSAGTSQSGGTSSGTSGSTNSGVSSGSVGTGTTTAIRTATTPSCTNACSPVGAKKCSGNYALYCGDFDGNGCYEWGNSVGCTAGCLNGICNAGLTLNSEISRCYESNPTHNLSISGNVTDKYGSIGFDSCYNGTTLRQYRCASDNSSAYSLIYCQHGCDVGACLSGAQVAINANPNNDGTVNCTSCNSEQTCSNGVCVANIVNAPVVNCEQSLATLEAEQKAAQETQQTQWTRAFEINSEMKKR